MGDDDEVDEEELQLDYEEKCNEVVELRAELRAAKIESQQLRLRLQAAVAKGGGAQGGGGAAAVGMPAAMPGMAPQPLPGQELRPTISWLAEHVDLNRPLELLDVGFEVPIGGRTVHLQRVAQWPLALPAPSTTRLRLSVPMEEQEAVAAFLAAVKARGNTPEPEALAAFAAHWELVPGDLTTATHAHPEPAVLLAHRHRVYGILVATWPTREALDAFHALHSTNGEAPRVGDRVEVEYEGDWYAGVLHAVDAAGKASVKCDVDEEGVFTIAPLHRVKPIPGSGGAGGDGGVAAGAGAGGGNAGGAGAGGGAAGDGAGSGPSSAAAADKAELLRRRILSEDTANNSGVAAARPAPHRRTRSEPGHLP